MWRRAQPPLWGDPAPIRRTSNYQEPSNVSLAVLLGRNKITFTDRYAEMVTIRRDTGMPGTVRITIHRMTDAEASVLPRVNNNTLPVSEDIWHEPAPPRQYVALYENHRVELLCGGNMLYVRDLSTPMEITTSWIGYLPPDAVELTGPDDVLCPTNACVDVELADVIRYVPCLQAPQNVVCANCKRRGHTLAICVGPTEPEGDIVGCPTCNTQEHDFDQCRMPLAPGKTTYDVLITARGNRPQVRTRTVDTDLLMLSRGKRFTDYPWSKDYARHQGNHRWAAFDYSRNESADLPIDPTGPGGEIIEGRMQGLTLAELEAREYGTDNNRD